MLKQRFASREERHIIATSSYVERIFSSQRQAHFHAIPNPISLVFFGLRTNGIVPKVVFNADPIAAGLGYLIASLFGEAVLPQGRKC
jgi:hypothetical protein